MKKTKAKTAKKPKATTVVKASKPKMSATAERAYKTLKKEEDKPIPPIESKLLAAKMKTKEAKKEKERKSFIYMLVR